MKLVYFAWVRERIGKDAEEVSPPDHVRNVGDLIGWLAEQDEAYAYAFEQGALVRAAIDKKHVKHDTPIAGVREIAFFPPMTGG